MSTVGQGKRSARQDRVIPLHVGSLLASQYGNEVNAPDPCSLGLGNIDEKDRPDAGNHILLGRSHHISQ
ncbi:hypothetical protein EMPG_17689 [Blastomyces silverae]|uniref:Uncharacterized protein n=1 Tax=Blastomyces silverae TaxID=2060906 RepID=A0A0H1B5Y1_9EURO|nr:hypothetical protein EMPG_17689 [Blastomyces silverae]